MIYDAFISYRHTPLDMEAAKKLHRSLENYHIPAAVQKRTGKKKINRVFRDQEELPIGSDLDDKISSALQESEYLIVICSPDTPGSYWVCKEIETFIRMHDREHVLAVLISGEPYESFPAQITVDDKGNPVEPLAADIRGTDRRERNKKFNTEFLRLAAPLIGCSYDDLRQRHREQKIRKMITAVSAALLLIAAAGTAFGIYQSVIARQMEKMAEERTELAEKMTELAGEKTKLAADILEEYRDKQINQSRFYASEALSLLEEGDRRAAVLVAAEGLPSEKNDRPYVPEAEYALSKALFAYANGSDLEFDRLLEHDVNLDSCHLSRDGDKLVSIDIANSVYIWDCSDWSLLTKITSELDEDGDIPEVCSAYADKDGIYIAYEDSFRKFSYDGNMVYSLPRKELHNAYVYEDMGTAYLLMRDNIEQIDLKEGKILRSFENPSDEGFSSKMFYDTEHELLVCGHYDPDEGNTSITMIYPENEIVTDVTLSNSHLFNFAFCEDGNLAVVSGDKDFIVSSDLKSISAELISPSGELLWSQNVDLEIRNFSDLLINIRSHSFPMDGREKGTIVITVKDRLFSLDEADGELIVKTNLPGDCSKILLNDDNPRGFLVFTNGDINLMDFENGKTYPENSLYYDLYMWDLISANGNVVIRTRFDSALHVLAYHSASDLEDIAEFEDSMQIVGVSPERDYFVMNPGSESQHLFFYDMNGLELYDMSINGEYINESFFVGSEFMAFCGKSLYIIDPIKKCTENISYQELGVEYNVGHTRLSNDHRYAAMWSTSCIYLVDLYDQNCILKYQCDHMVADAVPADDGKMIYISELDTPLYSLDVESGDVHDVSEKKILSNTNIAYHDFMKISPDGKMLSVMSADHQLSFINLKQEKIISSFPVKFSSNVYMRFSDDSRYFYIQTDDYVFRIWDIRNNEFVCSFNTENAMFKYEIYDKGSNKLVLGNTYNLSVIDTEKNGLVTVVPRGVAFLKNNSFIIYNKKHLYRTYYKDYQKLLEEISAQFTDTTLSSEEKVRYNIN